MAAPDVQHQSFAIDRHHSLQEFVLPESLRYDTPFDHFAAENQFPVIDLADLDGEGPHEEVMAKLVTAAETWGFFNVVNHGVPREVIQKIMAHVEKFFARPIEEKMRVKSDMPRKYKGYTPGNMIVDVDGRHPSWTERLFFERKADALQALAEQVWREDDGQVSQDLKQYMDHMDSLSYRLIGLLCEGIAKDSSQKFKAFHDNTTGHFIAAHYPPCPRPDLARGLRAHTDPHSLSILYQEYPGLQLLKDGKWLAVKPEVGALVVNIGDMMQIWSNGQYQSVQHRVALNSTTGRFSLIFFKNPRLDEVISAPTELVNEAHPRKYKDVSWKEYMMLIRNGQSKAGHLLEKITIA